ncbi:MAG TPA: hypothetical protein VMB21_07000 [Candidatus Limnocylindria bacterium]|nr:hypothetical protein [Candidatus Limnocylindria bacterium]
MTAIFGARVGSPSRSANPGLSLRFVGFTNISGQWLAQMGVTNESGHTHFIRSSNASPEFLGQAKMQNLTYLLSGSPQDTGPLSLEPEEGRSFLVELPKQTESWEVSVRCYRTDAISRSLVERPDLLKKCPPWLAKYLIQRVLEPAFAHDFQVSSGILTNRPPDP